jgi:hypothetical protein
MSVVLNNIWLFRIIPRQNLRSVLEGGLYCKNAAREDNGYITIGSQEVITRRGSAEVKCFTGTFVNDYVPFYFSVRTPMMYNIITGHGVIPVPQENIIYLCFRLQDLVTSDFQWCYTDGNAASAITHFFTNLEEIESNLDWHSIRTTDFRDNNADGDEDRIRKKHSEFLVRNYVPSDKIRRIVVLNCKIEREVQELMKSLGVDIELIIDHKGRFYFL